VRLPTTALEGGEASEGAGMAKSGTRVGIDLEQSSLAGAQVKGTAQGLSLTHVAVRALQEGLIFEGEVVDVDALATELKAFWKDSGFTGKRFALGVANQKIVVRTMEFPIIDEKELRAAIEFQAQEAIPIPLDEAILDFQVLSTVPSEEGGGGKQRVLIVAAQRDMIRRFIEVAKKAGLTMDGIDLQAFALMRSVAPPVAFVDQGASEGAEAAALVNIGSGITNLVVAVGGVPQFTRVINLGYDALVDALVANRGLPRIDADALRINVGLSGNDPAVGDLEATTVSEVHEVLDASCEAFADEIRRSVDYYHSQEHEGQISTLLLSGEGALTRNICGYLSQALHLGVQLGNPLQHIMENKSNWPQPELEAMSPRLAIALGLAIDDEG
jgi:type IV pilus assembly protein PilM